MTRILADFNVFYFKIDIAIYIDIAIDIDIDIAIETATPLFLKNQISKQL